MSDVDLSEFEALASQNYKKPCLVGAAITALDGEDRAKLVAAVASPSIRAGAIEKWAKMRGHVVNTSAVISHRNRRCTCADA